MEEENKDKLDNKKNVKESVSCDNNEKVKKIDAKSEKEDNKKDNEEDIAKVLKEALEGI